MTSTRNTQFVKATPAEAYAAFMDPAALMEWLPPADMTARLHHFEPRVGGGYAMSLFYSEDETAYRGKTAEREDRVEVRFVELVPGRRIVETIVFATDDPALKGEMTMTATFAEAPGGADVTMVFDNLPPGLKPEDNEAGAAMSLSQLARRFAS